MSKQVPRHTKRASGILVAILLISMASSSRGADELPPIETVTVYADFREASAQDLAASVTVLDAWTIESAGQQHFEELISLVPNLNWAGGTSRPRYLQIRGIGERSQYQGAPNPSVGFIVDDIDFSGIGMVATLFDLQQVEVLRGPQGTRYGANALAGLVNLRSTEPTREVSGRIAISAGSDGARSTGLAIGGPLIRQMDSSEGPAVRFAVHNYRSDGFRDNTFLGRNNTNGRDETTVRFKLTAPLDHLDAHFAAMYVDLNNGYDAFAIDNSLATLSDRPGKDSQTSKAMSLRLNWSASDLFDLESISSVADSDIEFSFDGDWGNNPGWAPYDPYDFYSQTFRQRNTYGQELRMVSTPGSELFSGSSAWLAGVYVQRLEEHNDNEDQFNGELFSALQSDYEATSTALFARLDTSLGADVNLTSGLRLEHRRSRYRDTGGSDFSPSETMLGGQLVLARTINDNFNAYAGISRGYKAGGFNIGSRIPDERREFSAEYLWNLEAGLKGAWPAHGLSLNLGLFYMLRRDQQVSTSFQDDPNDPLSFTFFNDNAASGYNLGLEADGRWRLSDRWTVTGSLGLLKTRFQDYVTATRDISGRAQAHAPPYTFSLGALYEHPRGLYARVDVSGKGRFFYSDSHEQKSKAYQLVNARAGWSNDAWDLYVWGNNVLNRHYTVRGFYFGNEPPDFAARLYTRQGDPRIAGIGLDYRF